MNSKGKVTIVEIAEKAGVSASTVSRVLRDSVGVSEEKRTAVMQAVEELNYQPNIFAQSLASGQSMTIGVLTQYFGNPFYDAIIRGIIGSLKGSDYSPIFADGQWQPAVEEKALQTFLSRRVDGLIIVGGSMPGKILHDIDKKVPLVVAAREISELDNCCFAIDNFQGAYNATQYLIDFGHREIAHITGMAVHQDDARLRRDGYLQALADAGIEHDPGLIVEGNFLEQSGVLAIQTLLTRGRTFSAIFAANDQMAFGARLALSRHRIRVPDDVSLVGFDDQPTSAFMTPPLTTVMQPAEELGQAAAQAILKKIAGHSIVPGKFNTELIVRESVRRLR